MIGPTTEVIAGNGKILTAGTIDCHVHLISPTSSSTRRSPAAPPRIIGGGTGPAEGTKATTVTPGAWNLARMLEALDAWPVNVLLLGKGNTVSADGACGSSCGTGPAVSSCTRTGARRRPPSTPA